MALSKYDILEKIVDMKRLKEFNLVVNRRTHHGIVESVRIERLPRIMEIVKKMDSSITALFVTMGKNIPPRNNVALRARRGRAGAQPARS